MRYLITILAISVFVLFANTAQAECPGPATLAVDYDSDLGLLSTCSDDLVIDKKECPDVSWRWDFHRTDKSCGRTIVFAAIVNTSVTSVEIDSDDYCYEANYYTSGSGTVLWSPVKICMVLDPSNDDTGHFTNLEFVATYE